MNNVDQRIELEGFDLEGYINNYIGVTRVLRLLFIAKLNKGTYLFKECTDLIVKELLQSSYTGVYKEIIDEVGHHLSSEQRRDLQQWNTDQSASHQGKLQQLYKDLERGKMSIQKESIRTQMLNLAVEYYNHAEFKDAIKYYVKTQDFSSNNIQQIGISSNILKCFLVRGDEKNNSQVLFSNLRRIQSYPEGNKDFKSLQANSQCAQGLFDLIQGKFQQAAKIFMQIDSEVVQNNSEIISFQDVTLYGTLCALASLSRNELLKYSQNNLTYKEYLQSLPNVMDVLVAFQQSNYRGVQQYVDRLKPQIHNDMFLSQHSEALFSQIRNKLLLQFCQPYKQLRLSYLSEAFNMDDESMQLEIMQLIKSRQLNSRLDVKNNVICSQQLSEEQISHLKLFENGQKYLKDVKALILRLNIIKNDYVQKYPQHSKKQEKMLEFGDYFGAHHSDDQDQPSQSQ